MSIVFDPGRIAPSDWSHVERYPACRMLEVVTDPATPVPTSRDWKCPVTTNQGHFPFCTGHSASMWMTTMCQAKYKTILPFDANGIYYWANSNDGDPQPHNGSTVRAAMECMLQLGALDLATSPPAAEGPEHREHVKQYLWCASAAEAINYALTVSPLVIGINWYSSMFRPDAEHIIRIDATAQPVGGHAIMVDAIDTTRGLLAVHNSWGPRWGDNGRAWLPLTDFERLMGEDGEASAGVSTAVV